MIEKAYLVPHPPIILPEIGQGEEKQIQDTIDSMKRIANEIREIEPNTIIISSPHAPYYRDVFYLAKGEKARGNMGQYGVDLGLEICYDQELAYEIANVDMSLPIYYTEEDASDLDHGSFIPLRFIKELYKDFKAIIIGPSTLNGKYHYYLGKKIREAVDKLGRKSVFIASGDLSHVLKEDGPYGYKTSGPVFDKKIMDILARASFEELLSFPEDLIEEACQCGIDSLRIMAGVFDGQDVEAEKYSYDDAFGVGYGVVSFESSGPNKEREFLRLEKSNDPYISLARQSIEAYIKDKKIINPPCDLPKDMVDNRAGVFVSIDKFDDLRGCIGTIEATSPSISHEIIKNAISSASQDPRFHEILEEEFEYLEISVDIMGEPEKIDDLSLIDPINYGLIVEKDEKRGLILPNIEGIDTGEDQLAIALSKAQISPDEDYDLYIFQVTRHD